MAGAAGPVPAAERLALLDLLRGFAIAGIILVNVRFFATPLLSVPEYRVADEFPGLADRLAEWSVQVLAEGKLYPLLALLFGYGFGLQLERAGEPAWPYRRRLLALLALGLAHAFLLWAGDVLVAYAVVGAVLVAFRRRSDRALLAWAATLYAAYAAIVLLAGLAYLAAGEAGGGASAEEVTATFAEGSFEEVLAQRALDAAFAVPIGIVAAGPGFLAMMLLGLWAQRRGVFRGPGAYRRLLRQVALWGLLAGGACSVVYATLWWSSGGRGAAAVVATLVGTGGYAQALGYAAALTLLVAGGRGRLLAPLRAIGRLALTNYLFQSLVATTIFYGYGLGLFGRVGPAAGLGVALLIAAAGAVLSSFWLRAFRIGPVEWLLRSITYARPQPLRRG